MEPASDASTVVAGPTTTARVLVERPPPGLAQGRYESPAWFIVTAGGIGVALGIAFIVWRFWRLSRS